MVGVLLSCEKLSFGSLNSLTTSFFGVSVDTFGKYVVVAVEEDALVDVGAIEATVVDE